ncbi:LEAF RUST 10 DISEASE-RESISTANCE LOCUS RECEPTOR-LIKE PROTEIN KINASE-like 1.5 [Chenopodium quinoa]|uniref:LEAF RUST 10 DISEASE-RESISTANCE LOCUS RECEPTOR-LIKE PROTEIN KINASE-like 1.5 n=1 Tax=Chenopodium quinoa TaxID=63459 RepID=UPI000B78CB1A|nr:LEAF RUST 10 DISEASE-RESISTANCE LOCUS RECEPTOR-LIKE PROTEIN KINASE-like 1.5 [Chenopodium quinoa]
MPPFFIFLFLLPFSSAEFNPYHLHHNHTCSTTVQPLHCPPFNTTPPYPFSTTPGCGHPDFHLHCSPNSSSYLIINNLSFSLLSYDPFSSLLLLSPLSLSSPHNTCSSLSSSIPPHPINLTNTPFKITDTYCSRLSILKPCPTLSLPDCELCPWHCSLIKHPLRLTPGCGPSSQPATEQGCQNDVIGYLDKFLKYGIQVEFELTHDEFFNKCNDCRLNRNGVCGFNSSDPNKQFLCLHESILPPPSLWVQHKKHIAEFTSAVVLMCLLCFVGVSLFALRNGRFGGNGGGNNGAMLEDPMTVFLHNHRSASLLPPVFTYEELESSTNRFDPNRKIGDGGFGSVFLGKLFDGRTVAVKYLHRHGGKAVPTKSFCNEILILSSIEHPNLVKLHGYCSDPRGLLLVYDYIPNGTLADHLHGPNRQISGSLSWPTRVDVALQIAIAIEYLHFTVQPAVVHRDITATNIFVDQYMRVRVGDFGLSRLLVCPEKNLSGELPGSSSGCVWTGPQGTPGYLDPDYHKSFRLTEKSDVFSFGVVLLELITGLKAVDLRREKREVGLVDMVVARIQIGLLDQVVDPTLAAEGPAVVESVAAVAELAFRCVADDKDDRPDAREVVAELRRIWSRIRGVRVSNSSVVVVPAAAEG